MQAQAAQPPPPPSQPPRAQPTPSKRIQNLSQGTSTETAMPAVNIVPPSSVPPPAPPRTPSMSMKKPPSSPPAQAEKAGDNPPSIVISADLESEVIETNESTTMRNPRARGPREHAIGERDTEMCAQRAQMRLRRVQEFVRVDDRRRGAVTIGDLVE